MKPLWSAILAATLWICLVPSFGLAAESSLVELPSIEGRWVQINAKGGAGHKLEIGTIDIAKCDEGLCARLVQNDTCGPVVMRLAAKDFQYTGTLKLESNEFSILLREDIKNKKQRTILASQGANPWSRRAMVLSATFAPAGVARCPNSPTS